MKESIPHIEHYARDKALKMVVSKKYVGSGRGVREYVEFMTGETIRELGPDELLSLFAEVYPKPGAGIREWSEYHHKVIQAFDFKTMRDWSIRIIERAQEQLEEHGPMQGGLL